jgi:hypothetical protein
VMAHAGEAATATDAASTVAMRATRFSCVHVNCRGTRREVARMGGTVGLVQPPYRRQLPYVTTMGGGFSAITSCGVIRRFLDSSS